MKKWILRLVYAFAVLAPVVAIADYTATTGSGTTIFAFVCSATKVCPATVLIDSTNVEKATAGNPLRVDPTGTTTQPVNEAQINGVTPLMGNGTTGTGSQRVTIASDNTAFSVNAAQSGTWTVQPGNTPNTSPWLVTSGPASTLTTLSAWNSGTAGNTTQSLFSAGGWASVALQLDQTTTITTGAITIEGTFDGSNWVTVPVAQVLNPNTLAPLTNPYTLVASTNQPFLILTQGYQAVRIRLSTTITGTGAVTPFVALLPYNPVIGALLNPLAAGSAIIGKVGIDQTTPGTTNGVAVAPDSGTVTAGTTTVAGTTASNLVAKASAGNLQNVYVDSSAAGWVFLINATSLPANATLTIGTASGNLQGCFELPKANTEFVGSQNYNPGPWEQFSVGITVAISSTSCPVLTAASTGKFIHAQVK